MFETLKRGDRISWWDDGHGRGAAADTPGAVLRHGVVEAIHRHPTEPSRRVVAVGVAVAGQFGKFGTTIRPDYGHQPTLDE